MTLVSNDPSWWPVINASLVSSYFAVAASIGVIYDWALTFGQEVELVWRRHWSLMNVLYLSLRYLGILYAVFTILGSVPTIPLTDVVSLIVYLIWNSTSVIAFAILGVIMIARINAMYQRSRKVLVFLVVTFLAVNIVNDVTSAITMRDTSGEELILSNTYQCTTSSEGDVPLLSSINWILATVWEILALCLAVWIAVKHLRELRGQSAGGIIGDCFTELIKTHVIYFASVVAVSCLELVYFFSPILADPYSLTTLIYGCICGFFRIVQMFVLGPRLILSIREYNAKQVADADAGTAMTSIAFQAGVQASNSSSV